MTIESHDGYWTTEAAEISQEGGAPFYGFHALVSAAGKHGEYAGVMINDSHLTITTARELAAALIMHAEIAEAQSLTEVAFSSEMVAGALS